MFYTSDSISVDSMLIDTPVVGRRVYRDNPDWSINTFFGNFGFDHDEACEPTVQSVAVEAGYGRVAAWSDSTVFSMFAMPIDGQVQLMTGFVSWLNRRSTISNERAVLKSAGLVVLAIMCGLLVVRRKSATELTVAYCCGFMISLPCCSLLSIGIRDLDWKIFKTDSVTMLVPEKSLSLPIIYMEGSNASYSYLTALTVFYRVSEIASSSTTVKEAMAAKCIIAPTGSYPLDTNEAERLWHYVNAGGTVMVLDGANCTSVWKGLSSKCGVTISDRVQKSVLIKTKSGARVGKEDIRFILEGGEPFLLTSDGQCVGTSVKVGKGRFLMSVTSNLFSDFSLGANSEIPNAAQYDLMRILWSGLRGG